MKQVTKLALIAFSAAAFGAAVTLFAKTTSDKSNALVADEFVGDSNSAEGNGAWVRTAAAAPAEETDFTEAAEMTINAVVSVKTYATVRTSQQSLNSNGLFIDPFEFFFGPNNGNSQRHQQRQNEESLKPQQTGLGSGVIISQDGYIVTNNHVISGAEKVEVALNDNRTFNARIVGSDETTDVALLKIEATGLHTISFGDSDALKIGEWVLAVGNPFGFTSTVTAGIVSAKARSISQGQQGKSIGIESFIQTDAAVNPGNSGGALVNTRGELVGINTAIYSQTGNYAGYSFAIPSLLVKKVVEDIMEYGAVQRAVLGVRFQELTAEIAEKNGITAVSEGIYVAEVVERSAAMEAGLKEGDVIIKVNGNAVKNTGSMMEQMNKLRPGDVAEITYIRDNKTHVAKVTMKNNQGNTEITRPTDVIDLGCMFKSLSDQRKRELGIRNGVEVVDLKDGKFKNAGIREGFIIVRINNSPISSQEDMETIYNSIMKSSDDDKVMYIVGIYPTGTKKYYAVDLAD